MLNKQSLSKCTTGILGFFLMRQKGLYAMICIYFVSRRLIMENNIQLPEGLRFDDILYPGQILFYANSIGVLKDIIPYNYRVREESITKAVSKEKIKDNFKAHLLLKGFLEEKGQLEKYNDAFLINFLVFCVYFNFIDYFRLPKKKGMRSWSKS